MKRIKYRPILLAVVVGLAALYAMMGTMGAAPVQAFDPMYPDELIDLNWSVVVTFDGFVLDDMGNLLGYAETHSGTVTCSENSCDRSITVVLSSTRGTVGITYGTSVPVTDTAEVKARGTGSIDMGPGQGETFTFTATLADNGDGTVSAKYEASRTEASFTLPRTPGSIEFGND